MSGQASSTDRRLDWVAPGLLALAPVATAQAAYQSHRWAGG